MPTGYEQDMWKAVRVLAEQSLEQTKATEQRNRLLQDQNKLLERIAVAVERLVERGMPRL